MLSEKNYNGQKTLLTVVGTSNHDLEDSCRALANTEWSTGIFMLCEKDGHSNANQAQVELFDHFAKLETLIILVASEHPVAVKQAMVLSDAAKVRGILSIVVMSDTMRQATEHTTKTSLDMAHFQTHMDSVLIVPTKRTTIKKGAEVLDKEAVRNEIFYQNVLGFLSVMNERVDAEGICLDPADVNAIFKNAGLVHMGVGRASGRNKAERAVKEVIEDSLPENALDTARRVLVQITGSEDVKLEEIESVVMQVVKNTHPEVTMLFGASFDKDFEDELYITVFASEFDA